MKKYKELYLILEMETGLLDGWYSRKIDAENALMCIHRDRPNFRHSLLKLIENRGGTEITDDIYLFDNVESNEIN